MRASPDAGPGASPAERDRLTLEARARALARSGEPGDAEREVELVTFTLVGERYAVDAGVLLAIARVDRVTTLPGAGSTVYGVVAWRGELLLVRDCRSVLGHPADPEWRPGWVLVVGREHATFGLLVEEVGEFIRVPVSRVVLVAGRDGGGRSLVRGVVEETWMVLDAVELFNLHR